MSDISAPISSHDMRTRRIISAARRVFLKHGYDGASMDDVAMEAGVSKRTVYNRYISKDELFDDVAREACQTLLSFEFKAPESIRPSEYLRLYAEALLETRSSVECISLLRNLYFRAHSMESLEKGYKEFGVDPVIDHLKAYFETEIQRRGAAAIDFDDAAWTFFCLVREPFESKLLISGDGWRDLATSLQAQAQNAVAKFLKLYDVFAD